MALKKQKNIAQAIKNRRPNAKQSTKTIAGSMFRLAGTLLNAPGYTWIGNTLDKLIKGDPEQQSQDNEKQQETSGQSRALKKDLKKVSASLTRSNRLQQAAVEILSNIQKDISFIKNRVSVTFFQVKDLSGEMKSVMYDPLGPAGGQFRRAEEGGTLTAKLPKELEEKVISKVASYTLKEYKKEQEEKLQKIEFKIDKLTENTDPTKFKDPTEDPTALDPIERLRREMNEGFEKIMEMLKNLKGDGLLDGLRDNTGLLGLLGLANIKTLKNILKYLGRAGLVGLAGFIGYKVGEWLNETFKLSERINDGIQGIKDFLGESQAEKEKLAEQQYAQFYREYQNKLLAGTDYMRQNDGSFINVKTREVFKFGKDIPDATVRNLLESARNLQTRKEFDTNQDGTLDRTELAAALEKIQKMKPSEIQSDVRSTALREAGVSTFLREKKASGEFPEKYQEPFLDYLDARYKITGDYPTGADLQKEMTDFLGGYFVDQPQAYTQRRVEELKSEKETERVEYEKRMALKRANVADYKTAPLENYQFEEIVETVPDATNPRRSVMKRTYRIKQEAPPETEMSDSERIKQGVVELESGDNYNAVFGDATGETEPFSPLKREKKLLTDMTIDEVEKYQGDARVDSDTTRAVGKYQFMRTTLFGKKDNPGLIDQYNAANPNDKIEGTDKFTPEVQDKLYDLLYANNEDYLQERGVPITPANMYMAHFLGPGGAKIVHDEYSSNPNSEKTVQQILRENDIDFGDANQSIKTKVPDFVKSIETKMAKAMPAEVSGPRPVDDLSSLRTQRVIDAKDAEEEAALYGTEGRNNSDLLMNIRPEINPADIEPEKGPVQPVPPASSTNGTDPAAAQTAGLPPIILNNNNNNMFNGNRNQFDSGISSTRPDDSSFGRNKLRDSNLPWEFQQMA